MNPYEPPQVPAPDTRGSDRFWALFLAVVSLFFCAPLTAPIAIFKAVRLLRGGGGDGFAVAALILSFVGLASSLLFWLLTIWQFLTPAAPH